MIMGVVSGSGTVETYKGSLSAMPKFHAYEQFYPHNKNNRYHSLDLIDIYTEAIINHFSSIMGKIYNITCSYGKSETLSQIISCSGLPYS